jgi:hypothetical protein
MPVFQKEVEEEERKAAEERRIEAERLAREEAERKAEEARVEAERQKEAARAEAAKREAEVRAAKAEARKALVNEYREGKFDVDELTRLVKALDQPSEEVVDKGKGRAISVHSSGNEDESPEGTDDEAEQALLPPRMLHKRKSSDQLGLREVEGKVSIGFYLFVYFS